MTTTPAGAAPVAGGDPSGRTTRILLIDAAERLFAERGINNVNLRDIAAAAGQRNTAAVVYHFGSKAGLLEAIVSHRMAAIVEERTPALARLHEQGQTRDPRAVLWAWVKPLANPKISAHFPAYFFRLQASGQAEEVFASILSEWTERNREVTDLLEGLVAHLPEGVAQLRIRLLYDGVTQALAREGRSGTALTDATLANLIDVWEAVVRTPASAEARALAPGS